MDLIPIPEDAEVAPTSKVLKWHHEMRLKDRPGRNILVAVDHGQDSHRAFGWALTHLVHISDTLHLVHVLPTHSSTSAVERNSDDVCYVPVHYGKSEDSSPVLQATEVLFDKLTKEAYEIARVKTERRIMEGDPGKVICRESVRLEPAALVMGCRGRGVLKCVLLGSVSEYCTRHCVCPVIIVPHKDDRVHELDAE